MDKKLFKYSLQSKAFPIILFIGTVIGSLLAFALATTESDDGSSVHSMIFSLMCFSAVIGSLVISSDLFSVAVAYNRSRKALLKTLTALFAVHSAITAALSLCLEFIAARIFTSLSLDYEFRPMLQNMGLSHAECTGFPGIIGSILFQAMFFLMLFAGGSFIFALFKRLPPKYGAAAWILFIFGINSFNFFGDLINFDVDLTAALRIGLVGAGLVIFTVLSTYCLKTCNADARSFFTSK